MKKSLAAACFVLLAHSLPVFADDAPQLPPPLAAVASVLELNNDQVNALLTMIQARDTAIRPLAVALQQHQQALEQALRAPDADPTAVGHLVLETRALCGKIDELRGQASAQFEQVLTPEQAARLQHVREAASIQDVVNAFRAAGLAP